MPTKTDIRNDIKSTLVAAANFGDRVYIGKYDPIPEDNLPAALDRFVAEEIDPITHLPRRVARVAEYAVDVYAVESSGAEVESALDTLCDAVEGAIDDDTTLGSTCRDCYPTRIEYEVSTENNKDFGRAEITLRVYYETLEG